METLEKIFASKLLKVKAIKLQPTNPFTWASGWKSPFYCDNRKTLSYPELRSFVKIEIGRLITERFPEADAIAVDTHVFRVSNRLGIADAKNVLDTEKQLMQAIPQNMWADSHHYLLLHGRYVCKAQRPLCNRCSVRDLCKTYAENNHE